MVLLALAATVMQWTGPRTEEYAGPGYFCGGGYAIRLVRGDRALVLPQSASAAIQGARVVIGGREVNLWSGAPRAGGPVVERFGGTVVTQQTEGDAISYTVSDETDFALRLTSREFRGFRQDGWFFKQADFSPRADNGVPCLAAISN